jgi:hypothetical protein
VITARRHRALSLAACCFDDVFLYGHIGTLDTVLDQANANGWIVVDMKKDWKEVFPQR